ncbi:hypothetical protein COL922a_005511 [Colletotrichum nupharicola]|nr:hypothetical protein COL922a_005511 [Colletotrichum nupharicola]
MDSLPSVDKIVPFDERFILRKNRVEVSRDQAVARLTEYLRRKPKLMRTQRRSPGKRVQMPPED